jgi:TetR/AcrR family fatty acid metabolism transcriptional regulator
MNEHSFKELVKVAQETKERIREAAVEIISQEGFFNTRMQDIADQAGLAVGTIYNYFSSKDKVLAYIFKSEMKRRMEIMSDLKEKDLSTKEFLKEFLNRHFSVLIENPHLGRVLVREKDFSRSEKSNQIKEHMSSLIKMLEKLFQAGVEKGEVKEINTHLMAVYFFGSMQGVIEYSLTQPEMQLLEAAPDFILERIDHIFN